MLRFIDCMPKDIHVLMEISLDELKKIQIAMDNCRITRHDEGIEYEEQRSAVDFFTGDFYKFISKTIEKLEEE